MKYQYYITSVWGDKIIYRFHKNETIGEYFNTNTKKWRTAFRTFPMSSRIWTLIPRDQARKLFPKAFRSIS